MCEMLSIYSGQSTAQKKNALYTNIYGTFVAHDRERNVAPPMRRYKTRTKKKNRYMPDIQMREILHQTLLLPSPSSLMQHPLYSLTTSLFIFLTGCSNIPGKHILPSCMRPSAPGPPSVSASSPQRCLLMGQFNHLLYRLRGNLEA